MKTRNHFFNNVYAYVLTLLLPCFPLSLSATTYTLTTDISTSSVPNASISSIMDSNHSTHIAWVATTPTGEQVKYGKYTSGGVFTSTTVSQEFYRVGSLSIVTDDSNNPHITYIIKRDPNPEYTFPRTGNYAVYYAGSTDGGSSFTNEQVSTNVADRNDNSDGLYHCYVNGRPQVGVNASGQVQVLYSSDSNSLNGYANFAILATRSGANSWSRSQEFDIDSLSNISHDSEFEMLPHPIAGNYLAWIDISNYDPHFLYSNTDTTITGYSGSFDNKHAQIDIDDSGNVHYFWLQDATNVVAFHHTILNGNSHGTVDQIDIAKQADGVTLKSVTGNLRPATIDPVTGKMYFIYFEGAFGTVDGTFLIEYDPGTQTSQEFELTGVGVAYGKRSLNVHNGFISFVGGSGGTTLYVTHIDAKNLGVVNTAPTISGTPPGSVALTENYSFAPTASDADGHSLTYTITGKPSWASFNTANGYLSGTPQAGDEGTYSGITISVSDGIDTATLPTFSIVVTLVSNTAPTISGTPSSSAIIDQSYSFTPSASDANGDSLTFSITNKPSWASFNTATGTLSGTPQVSNEGTSNGITISVSDGTDTTSLPVFSITVGAAVNIAPTISGTPDKNAIIGQNYVFTPSSDDANGDMLIYSITNRPSWASFNTVSGTLSGIPKSTDEGIYSDITISVSDGVDTVSLSSFAVKVSITGNVAPTISGTPDSRATIGKSYSFAPTGSDDDGDSLTYSIVGSPSWASFNTATGELSGTPQAGDEGENLDIIISVSDGIDTASLPGFSIKTVKASSGGGGSLAPYWLLLMLLQFWLRRR